MRVEGYATQDELRLAIRTARDSNGRDRLRIILHALEGETSRAIAERLGCGERVVRKWVHRYNEGAISALSNRPRSGRPRKLPAESEERVRERLDAAPRPEDGVCTLRGVDVRRILAEEFGVEYSESGTYVVLHRLGYSSLMPRPRHPKSDTAAQKEFEKNSSGDGAGDGLHASRRRDSGVGAG
jgi:transposase